MNDLVLFSIHPIFLFEFIFLSGKNIKDGIFLSGIIFYVSVLSMGRTLRKPM